MCPRPAPTPSVPPRGLALRLSSHAPSPPSRLLSTLVPRLLSSYSPTPVVPVSPLIPPRRVLTLPAGSPQIISHSLPSGFPPAPLSAHLPPVPPQAPELSPWVPPGRRRRKCAAVGRAAARSERGREPGRRAAAAARFPGPGACAGTDRVAWGISGPSAAPFCGHLTTLFCRSPGTAPSAPRPPRSSPWDRRPSTGHLSRRHRGEAGTQAAHIRCTTGLVSTQGPVPVLCREPARRIPMGSPAPRSIRPHLIPTGSPPPRSSRRRKGHRVYGAAPCVRPTLPQGECSSPASSLLCCLGASPAAVRRLRSA